MEATSPRLPTKDHLAPKGAQSFPIPLSRGKKAVIMFEALPVEKRDIEAIKKWLELFLDSLTETEGN